MLITIPEVLNANELAEARAALDAAVWIDGKVTAGYQAQSVKENLPVVGTSSGCGEVGRDGSGRAGSFSFVHLGGTAAARVSPDVQSLCGERPLWHSRGHCDSRHGFNGQRIRTDISATLFLNAPETMTRGTVG
jgi:PKHD-type hydroxylase